MTTHAIFFDDGRGRLEPLRDLRPIFDVRTGGLTTLERYLAAHDLALLSLFVPSELDALTRERHPSAAVNTLAKDAGAVLVINGRCPLPPAGFDQLAEGGALVDPSTGDVIAAHLDAADALRLLTGERPDMEEIGASAPDRGPLLMTRPWHVRSLRDACLEMDLRLLSRDIPHDIRHRERVTLIGREAPRVHGTARVFPGAIFNTDAGSIVVQERATVRPGAVITGPAFIGAGATVLEHAHIKSHTAIGPVCKVGGEVGGTIFQGHANKAHDGHLGDSWVGEWVNLGAGTVNSNLLNTYDEVKAVAEPGADAEPTDQTFLGCILGDHVTTAIGTRIMTGAVAHTGVMWSASSALSGALGRFTWVTDDGPTPYRMDKFERVMRAKMARRKATPGEAYLARIRELGGA